MIKLGQTPTPIEYVNTLLDYANYKSDIVGKKVLENSCGDGNILVEIVRRYILDGRRKKLSDEEIRKGMLNDIVGYDVDSKAISTAVYRLNSLCFDLNIQPIHWNIKQMDYLKQDLYEYDFIIGNPPYVTYHDLSFEQRLYLKDKYQSCKNGRFDYSYAFIEKSINALSKNGTLSYIVPFSIFRNKYAEVLRKMLLPKLELIIDYSGRDVFPNRTIGVAIIVCRQYVSDNLSFIKPEVNTDAIIEKKHLIDRWIFEDDRTLSSNRKFGDYFDIFNSVATLRNSVYLLKEYHIEGQFTVVGDYRIENQLVYNAVSPRSIKSKKRYKIIFPYYIGKNGVSVIPENELKCKFSCCYEYFIKNKIELEKRKISPNVYWYEYGRSQALTSILKEKLIIPMIISGKAVTHFSKKNEVPYAGYYIVAKTDMLSLDDAARFIESNEFWEYVKMVGTPTTKGSYRVSVVDIMEYSLP